MEQQQTTNSWQDKTVTLPIWKQDLLKNIEILDEEQLQTDLYDTIYVISDGGANPRNQTGSYGWIIANKRKELVTGGGLVRGSDISSFRAEAYGRLSVMSFLGTFT